MRREPQSVGWTKFPPYTTYFQKTSSFSLGTSPHYSASDRSLIAAFLQVFAEFTALNLRHSFEYHHVFKKQSVSRTVRQLRSFSRRSMPIVSKLATAQANDLAWHLVHGTTSRRVPWSTIVNGEEGLQLQSITAIPVVRPTPALKHNVQLLTRIRRLTKLVLSFDSSAQPMEVFGVLNGFECLEELEVTFDDVWRTLEDFPRIATLRHVTIKNVKLSEAALNSLAANTNLQSLRLQNVQYIGGLNALYQLTCLRRLEISGYVPELSRDISFLHSMADIEKVSLELEDPEEGVLETLRNSKAETSLKLHGCCIHAFSSELARIPNLAELTFVTTCCLGIPPEFQALSKLRSVSFVDRAVHRSSLEALDNLPPTVTKLSMDLQSISLPKNPFPNQQTSTITELVIRMPIIGKKLELSKFVNLQSLELMAKNELDGEVLEELKQLHFLEELKLGGCLNIERESLLHLAELPLESLSISNSTITPDTLSGVQSISRLRTLAFHSCFFIDFKLDSAASFNSPENLVLDRCSPIDDHLLDIFSTQFIRNVNSLQVGLSKELSDDQLLEVYSKQQELGLMLSIQYYEEA